MNHSFNNDSLDSGTSQDYNDGHSSDLGYNQHDNLNSDHHWQDLSQQHLDQHHGLGLQDGSHHHYSDYSQMQGLTETHDGFQNAHHHQHDLADAQHQHHSWGADEALNAWDANSWQVPGMDAGHSHHQQPEANLGSTLTDENYNSLGEHNHGLGEVFGKRELAAAYSSSSQCYPYVTIGTNGDIYKHTKDGSSYGNCVGHISGRSIYNSSSRYLGYVGSDSKIYDSGDHCVGWVDECGNIYNKKGIRISETNYGAMGGAAYMFLVHFGGAPR